MKKFQCENLNIENRMTYLFYRFCAGLRTIPSSFLKAALVLLYWVAVFLLILNTSAPTTDIFARLMQPVICIVIVLCSCVVFIACVTLSAIPLGASHIANAFLRIGVTNAADEPPFLTKRWQEDGKTVIELFSQGIPLTEFENHLEEIESALDRRITKVLEGHNKQHILLYLAPGSAKLPSKTYLPILDKYLPKIMLGESLDGSVIVDLNKQPHFLVAGSTGSGKTTLIKSIIAQLLIDRHSLCTVFLIDLKGGLDYPPTWRGDLCTIARLGRAFGINLFIGTQRPDANAIPGQIKNNLDVRICGKADNTLSMIILDSTDAATTIPKNSQGLFLNQDGTLFRGYLFDESLIGGGNI